MVCSSNHRRRGAYIATSLIVEEIDVQSGISFLFLPFVEDQFWKRNGITTLWIGGIPTKVRPWVVPKDSTTTRAR